MLDEVLQALRSYRYSFHTEDGLQLGIASALRNAGFSYVREAAMDAHDRLDFLVGLDPGGYVAIEAKIDGTANALLRQLHRYAQHDGIDALVVVTNRARLTQMPPELNGKPVRVVSLLDGGL